MHTVELPASNKIIYVPENLNECTPDQYMLFCRLIFKYQTNQINLLQFKKAAVYVLLNMNESKKERNDYEAAQINANLLLLFDLVDGFFTKDKDGVLQLKDHFTANPLPKIPTAWLNLIGPKHHFHQATFGEYVIALNIFSTYQATQDINLLYDLAAVYYRPHLFGLKIPFNENHISRIAQMLKNSDIGHIYGFYNYFSSFQNMLGTKKVYWEGKPIDFSILFTKTDGDQQPSEINGLGMKGTSYVLAESGVFGTLKDVNQTDMWEILFRLYDMKKRNIDHLNEIKRSKNENSTARKPA